MRRYRSIKNLVNIDREPEFIFGKIYREAPPKSRYAVYIIDEHGREGRMSSHNLSRWFVEVKSFKFGRNPR